nr:MAG TPA: hypothetical protein [Bacteriophage sp.]
MSLSPGCLHCFSCETLPEVHPALNLFLPAPSSHTSAFFPDVLLLYVFPEVPQRLHHHLPHNTAGLFWFCIRIPLDARQVVFQTLPPSALH